ncbi:ankyrin, partial [Melanomma pulvis-pyrius CBS 109.77]
SKFSLRFTMQWTALFPFGGPDHKAIQLGDEAYLQRKLASRALRVSDTTANGDTLLHATAGHSQRDLINMLINEGADPNAINNKGETPLHISVRTGRDYETARRLVAHGADICRADKDGRTPLHSFYNDATSQLIRYHGDAIDMYAQDNHGMTVLHWASWTSKSSPQDLTYHPPPPHPSAHSPFTIKDNSGKSVLHLAVERGNAALIAFLLSTPEADVLALPDHERRSLLHYATASGRIHLVDFFLERQSGDVHAADAGGR